MPAPYGGMDLKTPIIAVQSPNCENLLNFNTTNQGVVLRMGDVRTRTGSGASALSAVMGLFAADALTLFAASFDAGGIRFHNIDTGLLVYTSAAPVGTRSLSSFVFNKYLFIFGDTSTLAPGIAYNSGAGWAAAGWTGASLFPIGGNSYNNRAYLIQLNEAAYWYGGVDQIAGACTKVDLSSIVESNTTLSCIGSFTLSQQLSSQVVQSFIMANGEVLFYLGSYPGSGTDWKLIGKAKIAQPLSIQSTISYQGDTLVMTDTGLVSMRDLFLQGSQAARGLSISDPINAKWSKLVQGMRTALSNSNGPVTKGFLVGNVCGTFDARKDRIVVSFPYYMNDAISTTVAQEGNYFFIFDNQLQAWYTHQSGRYGGGKTPTKYYFMTNTNLLGWDSSTQDYVVWVKEGYANVFLDDDISGFTGLSYDYEILSAPAANSRAYVQKVGGMDVILKSDLYAETNYQLIENFGVTTTTAQKTSAPSGSLQKPYVNMGITGSYVQYKISGTTTSGKTVGLQLYGTNLWIEQGTKPR